MCPLPSSHCAQPLVPPQVHAMTFNLGLCLTPLGDVDVCACACFMWAEVKRGDVQCFSNLHRYSTPHFHQYLNFYPPFTSLYLHTQLTPSQSVHSSPPPPHTHFTLKYVVCGFSSSVIGLRGLDSTCCFESSDYQQFWSSSPLLTAETHSSGSAVVVSRTQAPELFI